MVSFHSPSYNFQNLISAAQLSFKYAYAQQVATNDDELPVGDGYQANTASVSISTLLPVRAVRSSVAVSGNSLEK